MMHGPINMRFNNAMILKTLLSNSQKRQCIFNMKISRLMLLRGITALYSGHSMSNENAFCGHNSEFAHVRDDCSFMYNFALKD